MLKTYSADAICTYNILDSNIHALYFSESTRKSTDIFFEILTDIYDACDANPLKKGEKVKVLFQAEKSELPLVYTFSSYRKWRASRKIHHAARLAILSGSQLLNPLVNSFIRSLRVGHLESNFFNKSQHADAVKWLNGDTY